MTTTPRPPEGVSVLHKNGTSTPCELHYDGMTDNTHTWTASAIVDFDTIATFHIDLLPAQTSVGFSLREPKGTP